MKRKVKDFLKKMYYGFLRWRDRRALKKGQIYFIRLRYKRLFGKKVNLKNPHTFAEKIQWLKLYDHNPKIILYADKYAVRDHIRNTIGEQYLIPLIAAWDRAEEIDFDALPEAFVIKPNNSSGRVFICKDKSKLDRQAAFEIIKKWESDNLTQETGEWFYEKIPYKIVCEMYLGDDISDYKLYFADGKFMCTQVIAGRYSGVKTFTYYDENWEKMNIVRYGTPASQEVEERPGTYAEMLEIAKKLATDFNFMRVDLYYIDGKTYFGELSFYPNCGFVRYQTDEMDEFFASKIKLPIETVD